MDQQQTQSVQVFQNNRGCFAGCGTFLAVILAVGAVVAYWYVAIPVAIVVAGVYYYFWDRKRQELALWETTVDDSAPALTKRDSLVLDQLKTLANLRDEGVLTESEFEAKKTELLKRL